RRKLREIDPPKPSLKLATFGDGAQEAARRRETDPSSLRGQLQGDLDAIVMKALEKEPSRRYGSASELSADIGPYLSHEPVLARPTSSLYRLGKYMRRHRVAMTSVASGALLLLVFAAAMTVQTIRIARERDRANVERARANTWFQHAREFLPPPRHDHASDMKGEVPEVARTLDALLWKARAELDERRVAEAKKRLGDILPFERNVVGEDFPP